MPSDCRAAPAAPASPRALAALAATAALAALAFLGVAVSGAAQTPCESGLRDAARSYELAMFTAVPEQLAPCFQQRTSRARLAEAYALLARAYLAADEPAKARQAVSGLLRTDPAFEPGPPPRFAQLVAQVRREEATVQVTSVSKSRESLSEAPATVVVVTAEEIERRGYLDLVQVLRDLPGLDIAVTGDVNRVNVFQRGFRSGAESRVLLLLDGVAQNDLTTNSPYLSRQYALSNVERVEVVYGPASTIYGANAYTGVINVITKEPEALVAEDKRLGLTVQAAAGGLRTRYADLTLAGKDRSGTVSWSVAGHLFRDDDTAELSRFADYRYDYAHVDYQARLRLTGPAARAFADSNPCGASSLYQCRRNDRGVLTSIELTPEGEAAARDLDRTFVQGNRFRFADPASDWSVYGKLRIANFILGLEAWRTREGLAALGSLGQDGRGTWAPRQLLLYVKYGQSVGRDLTFNAFIGYQQSALDVAGSTIGLLSTYANGALGLANLVSQSLAPSTSVSGFSELSTRIRGELNLAYEPSPKFSVVGGIEVWKSAIQSSFGPNPLAVDQIQIPPLQVEHTDLAAFAQASYKPIETLKLVFAGRLNYNTIDNRPPAIGQVAPGIELSSTPGFGTLFSPRAAVIYTPARGLVLKAIYSEAFKDPPDSEKFTSILGSIGAVNLNGRALAPEKVRNYELSASWQPAEAWAVQAAAYRADYTGLVGRGLLFPDCGDGSFCTQFENRDQFRIQGLSVEGRYRLGRNEISGNYSFTSPFQLAPQNFARTGPLLDDQGHPIRKLRIGQIAAHHLNLGINRDWLAGLNTDLRLRYVGPRPTGPKTTDASNPLDRIAGYTEARATVSYAAAVLRGATLQLIVDNLFGHTYFDPTSQPHGVAEVPQPGRTLFVRIITGLGRPRKAERLDY
jgi:outer membrane receptor for ferrienterochelin and colicins